MGKQLPLPIFNCMLEKAVKEWEILQQEHVIHPMMYRKETETCRLTITLMILLVEYNDCTVFLKKVQRNWNFKYCQGKMSKFKNTLNNVLKIKTDGSK